MALANLATAQTLFNVDFNSNNIGDNYTSVAGVGTNTNLVGALPNNITSARAAGDYSLVVDSSHRLSFTATGASNEGQGFEIYAPQVSPVTPVTWFLQFDYTRLSTTSGIMAINFLNASGDNMLGHQNNATLYADKFAPSPLSPTLAVGTHTLRLEVDSGTSNARAYVDGVQIPDFGIGAINTSAFGGFNIRPIAVVPTDFIFDNISGGVVPEPSTAVLLTVGGLASLFALRKRLPGK